MTSERRRYGEWSGNPNGYPEDRRKCIEEVYPEGQWHSRQCSRKRGHGPDGLYCKQHGAMEERRLENNRKALGQP